MKLLEKWTKLKFKEIIFDSDYCSWDINTSTFNKRIDRKGKLIITVEDEEINIFDEYINKEINIQKKNIYFIC